MCNIHKLLQVYLPVRYQFQRALVSFILSVDDEKNLIPTSFLILKVVSKRIAVFFRNGSSNRVVDNARGITFV